MGSVESFAAHRLEPGQVLELVTPNSIYYYRVDEPVVDGAPKRTAYLSREVTNPNLIDSSGVLSSEVECTHLASHTVLIYRDGNYLKTEGQGRAGYFDVGKAAWFILTLLSGSEESPDHTSRQSYSQTHITPVIEEIRLRQKQEAKT